MNETRKLASIQRIQSIHPIADAERIECAIVGAWPVVVKKNEFTPGSLCVFFEIDSIIPFAPWSEFLRDKKRPDKPIVLETVRLRGQKSQGLALPISVVLPDGQYEEGLDVTDLLGIKKYEPMEDVSLSGAQRTTFPRFIEKTDSKRLQSYVRVLDEFIGKEVYVTMKCDGSSMTAFTNNGEFGICSRSFILDETCEDNAYVRMSKTLNLRDNMLIMNSNIAIQGELCGPKINGNKMGYTNLNFFGFDVYDIDSRGYLDFKEQQEVFDYLGIKPVPLLYRGIFQWTSVQEIMNYVESLRYENGELCEGIVVRPVMETESPSLRGDRLHFKLVSDAFLEKFSSKRN